MDIIHNMATSGAIEHAMNQLFLTEIQHMYMYDTEHVRVHVMCLFCVMMMRVLILCMECYDDQTCVLDREKAVREKEEMHRLIDL